MASDNTKGVQKVTLMPISLIDIRGTRADDSRIWITGTELDSPLPHCFSPYSSNQSQDSVSLLHNKASPHIS